MRPGSSLFRSPVRTIAPHASAVDVPQGLLLRAICFLQRDDCDIATVVEQVREQGGWVVQARNDLVFAVFDSAVACMACLSQHTQHRIGVSLGDVMISGEQVLGLPVVEASRLLQLAEVGQAVCVDRFVKAVTGFSQQGWIGPASLELKGIDVPVESYTLPLAS